MYYQQFENKHELQTVIYQHLRNIGIKQRTKKLTLKQNDKTITEKRIFKTDLHLLETCEVSIEDENIRINVPRFVRDACTLIKKNLQVEGLFRKAGSHARQKIIREKLEENKQFDQESHVIDVANLLKTFFRDLPEPLIPYIFHDTFLHCLRLGKEKQKEMVLLTCLLLPEIHLHTLKYFMIFLNAVQNYSSSNKMNISNLSIVITPNIMPIDVHQMKLSYLASQRLTHHVNIIEFLIKNSKEIGLVPDFIIEKLTIHGHNLLTNDVNYGEEEKRKKKKRRSGSLTRMFNGLRKMVSGKNSVDEELLDEIHSPTECVTTAPLITKSNKRKAVEGMGFSNKKKRGVLQLLPQNSTLANTPFTTPKRKLERTPISAYACETDLKRSYLSIGHHKKEKRSSLEGDLHKAPSSTRIERRWSMINQISSWGKKKKASESSFTNTRNADADNLATATKDPENDDTEFMCIRKSEYEEIKNRVSAIENRLSKEFQDVPLTVNTSDTSLSTTDAASDVQNQYEKTLEEAGPLNNASTEQLATRLSRELKIRRNGETKIIRSPSARKIGTIRRRSRELDRKLNNQIIRNFSWHNESPPVRPPRTGGLRRGRPNTLYTGLPNPSPLRHNQSDCQAQSFESQSNNPIQINIATINLNNCNNILEQNSTTSRHDQWMSAETYFQSSTSPVVKQTRTPTNMPSRASIARLRSQNAGMVMAKAKLFDELVEPNHAIINQNDNINVTNKISKPTLHRKSKSPSTNKQKKKYVSYVTINANNLEINTQTSLEVNKENGINECDNIFTPSKTSLTPLKDSNRHSIHKVQSPKLTPPRLTTPRIKKPLHNKSPRHFIRTPQSSVLERNLRTPMKASHAIHYNSYQNGSTPIVTKKIATKRYSPKMCSQKSTAF